MVFRIEKYNALFQTETKNELPTKEMEKNVFLYANK